MLFCKFDGYCEKYSIRHEWKFSEKKKGNHIAIVLLALHVPIARNKTKQFFDQIPTLELKTSYLL